MAKKMVAGVVVALGLMAAAVLDRIARLGDAARWSRARFWLARNANMHLWRLMEVHALNWVGVRTASRISHA